MFLCISSCGWEIGIRSENTFEENDYLKRGPVAQQHQTLVIIYVCQREKDISICFYLSCIRSGLAVFVSFEHYFWLTNTSA